VFLVPVRGPADPALLLGSPPPLLAQFRIAFFFDPHDASNASPLDPSTAIEFLFDAHFLLGFFLWLLYWGDEAARAETAEGEEEIS